MNKILALLLALIVPPYAKAQTPGAASTQDVQGLYNSCKSPLGSGERTFCLGYISGIADQLSWMGENKAQHPEIAAICGQPSYGAMTQAFVNFAEKNPQTWGLHRIVGVVTALQLNWPCK
jgi:Rap1a immunity proteins